MIGNQNMNSTDGLLVFISPVLYNAMNKQDGVLNQFLNLFEKWSNEGSTYINSEKQNVIDNFILSNPICHKVLDLNENPNNDEDLMTENKDIIDENLVVYSPKDLGHLLLNIPDNFKDQRFVMIYV